MKRRLLLFVAALPAAACVRSATAPSAAPSPAPSSMSSATPAALPSPLPSPWIAGFPGWLGVATVASGGDMDAPAYAGAHVAIPDSSSAWSDLGATMTLPALAPGYSEDVRFTEKKTIRFGCDENRASFSFFRGERRPAPGPVWLVPPGTSASVDAAVEIREAGVPPAIRKAGEKTIRAWRLGRLTFVSRRTDASLVEEIWDGDTRLWRNDEKWTPMQGGDAVPPSLEGGPGVPIPRMRLVSGGAAVLVVQRDGFEGTGFHGYRVEGKTVTPAEGSLYLYWCAF